MAERLFGIDPDADWRTQTRQASQAYERGDMSYPEFVSEGLAIPTRALGEELQSYVPDFVTDAVRGALNLPGPRMFSAIAPELPSVQRAVAADQALTEQFPEGYPRAKRFAGNVATVAETGMGTMPFARATGISRTDDVKGMFASSFDVIKKGHYNPEDVEISGVEKAIGDALKLDFALPENKAAQLGNAYKTVKGTFGWGLDGLKRVGELMFNPSTRAMYTSYGISPVYRDIYKRYEAAVEAGDTAQADSILKIAHQQMQQMGNIKKQAGQVPTRQNATKDFIFAAADPDADQPFFNIAESGDNWYLNSTKGSKASYRGVRPDEASFIENHVMKVWGLDPKKTNVLIKTPRSEYTGNHFNDVLGRNPNVTEVARLFAREDGSFVPFESPQALQKAIQDLNTKATTYQRKSGSHKTGDRKVDPKTGKNKAPLFQIRGTDQDGVWLQMSKAGTAKVEGGVNMLIKVDTQGNLTGVMSDLHDFYESFRIPKTNIKIRNRPMEMALPNDVVAITPPMQTNVVSITGQTFNQTAQGNMRVPQAVSTPIPEAATKREVQGRVERAGGLYGNAPMVDIAAQSVPVAQNVVALESLLGNYEDEDPLAPSIR